ncbi:TPA: hypothetical protein GXZ34_03050 [bacterium]|nr:hypothetical protein [bacterium]
MRRSSNQDRFKNLAQLKEDLYLVVEGEADALFVNKIISFMSTKYNVRVRIAHGNGNIPIHVNILKKVYSYSKIVVLYDLDGHFDLVDIKRFLKNKEVDLKDRDIYFVNPCIEYFMILTKEINKEKFTHKKDYKELIFNHYGVRDYAGNIPQVEAIVEQIQYEDYHNFLNNLASISSKDYDLPSSNFIYFIRRIQK